MRGCSLLVAIFGSLIIMMNACRSFSYAFVTNTCLKRKPSSLRTRTCPSQCLFSLHSAHQGTALSEVGNSTTVSSTIHTTKKRPFQRIPVLRYHADWVCVNKPAGMTMHHGGKRRQKGPFLASRLKRQLSRKVYPVHRLDHRTSGAVLLAFSSERAADLHRRLRSAQKSYVALLRGHWSSVQPWDRENTTMAKISLLDDDEQAILVDKPLNTSEGVREARTRYTCLAQGTYRGQQACTLVLAEPLTGRTHQIRRHAYTMGMPVLGDTQHGCSVTNRWWRTEGNLRRLALHCLILDLSQNKLTEKSHNEDDNHSQNDGLSDCIVAPLPDDLRTVLQDDLPLLWSDGVRKEPRLTTEFYDFRGGTLEKEKD